MATLTSLVGSGSATQSSATSTGGTGTVAGMFNNPFDDLNDELEERRKKAMAAGQVGTAGTGNISTMMGYSGMATGNPLSLKPYG